MVVLVCGASGLGLWSSASQSQVTASGLWCQGARRLRIVTARVRGLRNPGAGLSARHERSVGNREFSFFSSSFLEAVLGDYSA